MSVQNIKHYFEGRRKLQEKTKKSEKRQKAAQRTVVGLRALCDSTHCPPTFLVF